MDINRAIVYVVYGKEYLQMALRSIESVGGQYPCIICGPNKRQISLSCGWAKVEAKALGLPPREYKHWFLDRVNYFNIIINHPHLQDIDQILFLDADTYICGSLTDWFTILDKFDIAATQAIAQQTLQRDDIPSSFPELHCGAMTVNVNWRIRDLFGEWLEVYQESPTYFGNDQPPLRQALWECLDIVQLAVLPVEFCFRYRWGALLSGRVRILHGKEHGTPYEEVAGQVNKETSIRIYYRRELA